MRVQNLTRNTLYLGLHMVVEHNIVDILIFFQIILNFKLQILIFFLQKTQLDLHL
jgi:hypothetical protein